MPPPSQRKGDKYPGFDDQTFNGLNALWQHIKGRARIHRIIADGGRKPTIVPEHAAALFYARAQENAYRDELMEKLRGCAEGAALATGAELSFKEVGHEYKAIRPNHALAQVFHCHIEELGYLVEESKGWMGFTDMGDGSWEVPAIPPISALPRGRYQAIPTSLPKPPGLKMQKRRCWLRPRPSPLWRWTFGPIPSSSAGCKRNSRKCTDLGHRRAVPHRGRRCGKADIPIRHLRRVERPG